MEWVDTHQHLWDLENSGLSLPWTVGAGKLEQSHTIVEYGAAAEGLGISKTLYMEVDVEAGDRQKEIDYISGLCADPSTTLYGAIVAGDPSDPEFAEYIKRNSSNQWVKGVRRVLHGDDTGPGYCLTDAFVAGVQLLGELGLTFDLCLRPAELADGATLAARCPGTTFVVDHCGNANAWTVDGKADPNPEGFLRMGTHTAEGWKADMRLLAAQPNTSCKLSGIIARAEPGWDASLLAPTYSFCIKTFGVDRCVFGGDWPVCTMGCNGETNIADHLSALRACMDEMGLTAQQQRSISWLNAHRVYGLDGGAAAAAL